MSKSKQSKEPRVHTETMLFIDMFCRSSELSDIDIIHLDAILNVLLDGNRVGDVDSRSWLRQELRITARYCRIWTSKSRPVLPSATESYIPNVIDRWPQGPRKSKGKTTK